MSRSNERESSTSSSIKHHKRNGSPMFLVIWRKSVVMVFNILVKNSSDAIIIDNQSMRGTKGEDTGEESCLGDCGQMGGYKVAGTSSSAPLINMERRSPAHRTGGSPCHCEVVAVELGSRRRGWSMTRRPGRARRTKMTRTWGEEGRLACLGPHSYLLQFSCGSAGEGGCRPQRLRGGARRSRWQPRWVEGGRGRCGSAKSPGTV